jgi:uncharacterized tellurite resistance protein B-like protein
MKNQNWSKSHFCTYLFLCIAKSDDKVTASEIHAIKDLLKSLKLDEADRAQDIIVNVCEMLSSQNSDNRIDFIKNTYSSFFDRNDELNEIMDSIEELILADNNIEKSEIQMYIKIRKALGIND